METKTYFGGGYVREGWLISHYDFSLPFRSAFTPLLSRCFGGDVSHEKNPPTFYYTGWLI